MSICVTAIDVKRVEFDIHIYKKIRDETFFLIILLATSTFLIEKKSNMEKIKCLHVITLQDKAFTSNNSEFWSKALFQTSILLESFHSTGSRVASGQIKQLKNYENMVFKWALHVDAAEQNNKHLTTSMKTANTIG